MADAKKLSAAEIQFKKAQRAQAGRKAVTDQEADAIAVQQKTERLKALRLARDAEEAAGKPDASAQKKPLGKTKTRAKAKQSSTTLSFA